MSFEAVSSYEDEDNSHYIEGQSLTRERIGGPLKPNDLLITKMGMEEATPILDQLNVRCKTSLFMAEAQLNAEATVPAEYRLEIMDPNEPEKPASEDYVHYVFSALKEAQVPVQKAARDESEVTENGAT